MAGKQAKLLTTSMVRAMLQHVRCNRHMLRDQTMILLSVRAGLRASEIAKLKWSMVLTPQRSISHVMELHDCAAKYGSGRTIPLHPELRRMLAQLYMQRGASGYVIESERGDGMRPSSVVNWFQQLYHALGYDGCSSHSGRRSFVTLAARTISQVGGSLIDVQQLAGHRSLETTQGYIEGDSAIKRKLIIRM